MAVDLETTNWNRARIKPKQKRVHDRDTNIFTGTTFYEEGKIGNVPVMRVSALPKGASTIPQSFSVVKDPEWKQVENLKLPYGLKWQQSKPARFDFFFDMPEQVKCLGLGERFSSLDLRGARHTLCSTDNYKHNESADSLYKAVPFLILVDGDKCLGFYVDSPAPQRWDLDSELDGEGIVHLYTRRGWRFYVIGPGSMADVVGAFTQLTGRVKLPPRWSIGHHQSRWSYPDDETVREIASEYRKRKIPCDAVVLDIDYMDEYRVFTNSPTRFPNLQKLVEDCGKQNLKVITIVDPGVKEDPDYAIFREGKSNNLFAKTALGNLFIDEVWPGQSAFPDFMKEETRAWWAKHHKWFIDKGIAGIWNDMNEPAFFSKRQPMPDDLDELPPESEQFFMQETPEGIVGHFEVRNLYGMMMDRATYEGLLQHRPNERPFVLSRSGFAGVQRYAAVWTGDNTSWYEHLDKSIPTLINLGLSGLAFNGADVGGFGGDILPELLVRWYEIGIFYPYFRNHCVMEGRAQEPWNFNDKVESHIRNLVQWRYKLLPYIQGLFWEHMRTGAPLMRPLSWHYPKDKVAVNIQDQFMFGSNIMVAPILERAQKQRPVYFPEGKWHRLEGGQVFEGGQIHLVDIPLGKVPAFVRDGSIIPLAGEMQSTQEYDSVPVTFAVFGNKATGVFFEDDGRTFDYEKGKYNEWSLKADQGVLSATATHKEYTSPNRELQTQYDGKVSKFSF